MLTIDLNGKRALVAGIADHRGFGFATARALARAGASVCAATWPPAYRSFVNMLERGKLDDASDLGDGSQMKFERIYPLDARYDEPENVPAEVRENRRYRELERYTVRDLASRLESDFGERPLDVLVHCIASGPEVTKALLDTSREGYLEAVSASAYSFVSMAQRLAPIMREGGSMVCLSFIAAERTVPGYGGGMSSAKAALESDTRVLAFEVGRRYGLRVNCISAGPCASTRAASAIGVVELMVAHVARHSPVPRAIEPSDVGAMAAFLASSLARAVTGTTVYVDHGSHSVAIGFTEAP